MSEKIKRSKLSKKIILTGVIMLLLVVGLPASYYIANQSVGANNVNSHADSGQKSQTMVIPPITRSPILPIISGHPVNIVHISPPPVDLSKIIVSKNESPNRYQCQYTYWSYQSFSDAYLYGDDVNSYIYALRDSYTNASCHAFYSETYIWQAPYTQGGWAGASVSRGAAVWRYYAGRNGTPYGIDFNSNVLYGGGCYQGLPFWLGTQGYYTGYAC